MFYPWFSFKWQGGGGKGTSKQTGSNLSPEKLKRRLKTSDFPLVLVSWQESQFKPTGFVVPLGLQPCIDLPGRLKFWKDKLRLAQSLFLFFQRVSISCFLLNLKTQSN